MPVRVQNGASTNFTASLQDFKNAFSLTDKGNFSHSVERTKGELYVNASGRLANANIHGGKGSVTSSVTNGALRMSLIKAFRDAGASEEFILNARAKLLGNENVAEKGLLRKDVKELFNAFEQDKLEWQAAVGRQVREAMTDTSKTLTLGDFRALANGTGLVGSMSMVEGSEDSIVVDHPDANDADYNESLRRGLYAVVRDAEVPEDLRTNRTVLLERLSRTLLAPQNLGKPLSCDEIRQTLKALDEGLGYVPPKALADRDIRALRQTGDKTSLSTLCKNYEEEARMIDKLLSSNAWKFLGVGPEETEALRRVAILRREMAAIGRQALGLKVVDVDHAMEKINAVRDDFCKANPVTLARLAKLRDYDQLMAKPFLQTILNSKAVLDVEGKLIPRTPTVPIESNSGFYIDKVLNNGAGGDCLFYSVADACKGLTKAANEPSDLTEANKMRADLAKHIDDLMRNQTVPTKKEDVKGVSTLHRDCDGYLHIPYSFGNTEVILFAETELTDPIFKKPNESIPTLQLPFLADMIKRPIVLLMDNDIGSTMLCYNRNLETGEKLTGEPIAIYFSGGADGHYQAVTLNDAGRTKLANLEMNEDDILAAGNDDAKMDKLSQKYDNELKGVEGVDPKSVNSPAVAEPVIAY